jgi:HlyD family secretion protein
MTISVDIEVARSAATVVVPADAVRDANSAQPWVLAVDGWRARRRAIRLGLKGDGRIEVLEGVAPGDRLISAANGTVREGQRVRATAPAKSNAP